ncbi:hypothetical protein [Celeribacter sp.]|uniref:hypothetical protein n=1 Tax=Celeribacter sp. TaxID=1890673 RepID=UPI003A9276B7
MKAIFYIGHHKVGSTSLQKFLSENAYALLKSGILYPAVESRGLAHMTRNALAGKDTETDLPINLREPHNALAFRMLSQLEGVTVPPYHKELPATPQMKFALRNQIAELEPHTVILCSEVMSNFGVLAPDMIDQLMRMFDTSDLDLYCTLRRPDDYLASWHGQRLKFNHKMRPLRGGATANYFEGIHFDYEKMLRPWVEKCPHATLHIRSYSDVVASGGSVEDFVAQVPVTFPKKLKTTASANPSIPRALMEFARIGNHNLSPEDAHFLRQFLIRAGSSMDIPPNGEVELFGAENRALMMDAFAPIHAYLSQITGKDAFFADIADMAHVRPVSEREANEQGLRQILMALQHTTIPDNIRAFFETFEFSDEYQLPETHL